MAFFRDVFSKTTNTKEASIMPKSVKTKEVAGGPSFPLAMSKSGEPQRVAMIKGKDETRRFLASLGFAEGAEVTLISEMNGNVIVNVKGTRVAVSKAMAMRVYVA